MTEKSKFDDKQERSDNYSLRGFVYQRLKDDILGGRYKDKEELREIAISEELGVSRTPVREALRQLELEKLVTIIPNKGAFVNEISGKDIKDVYLIRSRLEGMCARLVCENITDKQIEQLEENVYLAQFHASRGHMEQMAELDNGFHHILYEACNSRMLKNVLEEYHQYVIRIRRTTLSAKGRSVACNDEHRAIMEAIKERNADKAEELATLHVANAYDNIARTLNEEPL